MEDMGDLFQFGLSSLFCKKLNEKDYLIYNSYNMKNAIMMEINYSYKLLLIQSYVYFQRELPYFDLLLF